MAVKLGLAEPIPPGGGDAFMKTYQVFIRSPDGDFYSGSYGFRGGELSSFGFCLIGDCPEDGFLPGFETSVSDDNTEIVFLFDPIEGELTVSADVQTQETDAEDSAFVSSPYQGGSQIPFGNSEIEC